MAEYFYATTGPGGRPEAYVFVGLKDQYCQLHGEYIGKQVLGNRIKVSGRVAGTTSVMGLDQLTAESRQQISPICPRGNDE